MGVVRREESWRLEKREDGIYEVTYQEQPELKIITSDYSQRGFVDERTDFSVPTEEVDSFSDAESIFENMVEGKSPVEGAGGPVIGGGGASDIELSDSEGDLSDAPPAALLAGGLLAGGFLIAESGLATSSPMFLIGAALLILPLGVGVLTYRVYNDQGPSEAVDFLLNGADDEEGSGSDGEATKTPPAPENLRNDLYFERANRQCEWCDEPVDSPDVHHIKPRDEGGPNEPKNLIVLCPNCHRKADRGMISRSKLRRAISQ